MAPVCHTKRLTGVIRALPYIARIRNLRRGTKRKRDARAQTQDTVHRPWAQDVVESAIVRLKLLPRAKRQLVNPGSGKDMLLAETRYALVVLQIVRILDGRSFRPIPPVSTQVLHLGPSVRNYVREVVARLPHGELKGVVVALANTIIPVGGMDVRVRQAGTVGGSDASGTWCC